jgi:selenocysteine lyase/cysteine desulfurase
MQRRHSVRHLLWRGGVAAVSHALMLTGLYPALPHAFRAWSRHDLGERPWRGAFAEWGMAALLSVARPAGFFPLPGAARYETGGIPVMMAAMVNAGIDYVNKLGITNIRTHAKQLTDRLQKELPPLGYKPLTPIETQTPIVAFELKDAAATTKMLQAGHVAATVIGNENRIRLSVSVFNNHDDIDRAVSVLAGKTSSIL